MKRPTLEEVAAHAGVSRATVSRVVNGSPTVAPFITTNVQKSIDALNYVPNQAARSLMTRRTGTIALVAAESDTRVFGDPFFAGIIRGISLEAASAGLQLVLSMAQGYDDVGRVESFLQAGSVEGALLISEHEDLDVTTQLASVGIPLVVGGRPLRPRSGVSFVDNDNEYGGQLAAQHLRDGGRRTIGTITGPMDMSAGVDRLAGFKIGVGYRFDPDLVEYSDFTLAGGRSAAERLLARRPDVDALFVASDMMALGALSAIRAAGRSVPDDLALVGFDDVELAASSTPALSTVRQRTIDQGRLMVQVLRRALGQQVSDPLPELVQWAESGRVVLPVDFVRRESS